jgi:glutathione synthase
MKYVAIYADPLESLNPQVDGTLRLALEAQNLGMKPIFFTSQDLTLTRSGPLVEGVVVTLNVDCSIRAQEPITLPLGEAACILIRKDPPVDENYITTLQILHSASGKIGGQVNSRQAKTINNPASVLLYNEKLLPFYLPQFMPPTIVTKAMAQVATFAEAYPESVIKPLNGFGGRGVERFTKANISSLNLGEFHTVQQYIPLITAGEKRINFLKGKPVGAILKTPAPGEFRANSIYGSTLAPTELNPKEEEICTQIGALLKEKDIFFAGVDMIHGFVSEINITSPGLFVPFLEICGINMAKLFWESVLD